MLFQMILSMLVVIVVLFTVYYIFIWICCRGKYPHNLFSMERIERKMTKEEMERIMKKSIYESEEELEEEYDIVIIGSGVSASTAAGLLSRAGKKVLLLEKHDRLGGQGHVFEEGEFDFCAGIHITYGAERPVFSQLVNLLTNDTLKFKYLDESIDEFSIGGKTVRISGCGKYEGYKQSFYDSFPKEKESLKKFFREVEKAESSVQKFVARRCSPWYLRILFKLIRLDSSFHYYGRKTTMQVLDECGVRDEILKYILICPTLYYNTIGGHLNIFAIHSRILRIYNEKYIPIGGCGAFVSSILCNLERNGSIGICNAEVKNILISKKGRRHTVRGVELSNGRKVYCKTVISSAGVENTLQFLPKKVRSSLELSKLLHDNSHLVRNGNIFYIVVVCDGSPKEVGIENLGSFRFSKQRRWEEEEYFKKFRDDVKPPEFEGLEECIEVSAFTLDQFDPVFRKKHPNKTKFSVFTPINTKWFEDFEGMKTGSRGNEYEEIKGNLVDKIMKVMYERFPKMEDRVEVIDAGSNLTFEDYTYWKNGAFYGLAASYEKLNDFVGNDDVVHPIKGGDGNREDEGLFLVGQDVLCPGVVSAASSSFLAVGKILGRNLFLDAFVSSWKK